MRACAWGHRIAAGGLLAVLPLAAAGVHLALPRQAARPNLEDLVRTLRGQLIASDSSAVDTLDRIRQTLDAATRPRSFRELVQLVDAFSFEAALAKLDQASADLGLESRAA